MVYCGKASQGCQNCRKRRIKCDKVKPECSQCVRVGKKCPGYRDQLSLMFRDESKKVIKKAHAQWGTYGSPEQSQASDASSPSTSLSYASPPSSASRSSTKSPTADNALPNLNALISREPFVPNISQPLALTLDQRGYRFYVDHYLINFPDSPRTPEAVHNFLASGANSQHIMIAVGLAGLSNLQRNEELGQVARQKYVEALRHTGQMVAMTRNRPDEALWTAMRSIVSLALFEVVQGTSSLTSSGAMTHVIGAIALFRTVLPIRDLPYGGAAGIAQLLYSLFIPVQTSRMPFPPAFYECLDICKRLLPPIEHCSIDLAHAIAACLRLTDTADHVLLFDEQPDTEELIQQLLDLEATFQDLEGPLLKTYPFSRETGQFPPQAVFHGRYHIYTEIRLARLWNNYRWARILLNQAIVRALGNYPASSNKLISGSQRRQCFATLRAMAEDVLISAPTHWHHPLLDDKMVEQVSSVGVSNAGALNVPIFLSHLRVAACAPGVPSEYWEWAHDVLECVWRDIGMKHAKVLVDAMEARRPPPSTKESKGYLKFEAEGKGWPAVQHRLALSAGRDLNGGRVDSVCV